MFLVFQNCKHFCQSPYTTGKCVCQHNIALSNAEKIPTIHFVPT